jgi:uncharacterized protein
MKKLLFAVGIAILLCFNVNSIFAQKSKSSALLYKLTGKKLKKPSYLFGTIHITCQNEMIAQEKIDKYLAQTEQVAFELDMDDEKTIKAMGNALYLPADKNWVAALKPEELATVNETLKKFTGATAENFKQFRPSMLTIAFVANEKVLGCPIGSYEGSIVKSATAKKLQIEGLEGVEDQLAALDKPMEEEAKAIYKFAQNPQESIDGFRKMMEIYKMQSSDALYEYVEQESKTSGDSNFMEKLLTKRNLDWIPKMQAKMTEKPTFFAVGAAHLGGKNGVINLLRKKGYKVEAIKL